MPPWQLLFVALSGWGNQRQRQHSQGTQHRTGSRPTATNDLGHVVEVGTTAGEIISRERLGGLLKYYERDPNDVRKAA